MHENGKKNQGWLVLLTVIVWTLISLIVVFVDPDNVKDFVLPNSYFVMGITLGIGTFLLLTILLLSAKRSLWATIWIMIYIYLRINSLGGLFNAILILAVIVSGEIYFSLGQKKLEK